MDRRVAHLARAVVIWWRKTARSALWWLCSLGLLLTAGEAERVRRHVTPPALCIGSVPLLRGVCFPEQRQTRAAPL